MAQQFRKKPVVMPGPPDRKPDDKTIEGLRKAGRTPEELMATGKAQNDGYLMDCALVWQEDQENFKRAKARVEELDKQLATATKLCRDHGFEAIGDIEDTVRQILQVAITEKDNAETADKLLTAERKLADALAMGLEWALDASYTPAIVKCSPPIPESRKKAGPLPGGPQRNLIWP